MKLAVSLFLATVAVLAFSAARAAPAAPPEDGQARVTAWVLVELEEDAPPPVLDGRRLEPVFGRWYRLFLDRGERVDAALAQTAALPGVAGVYPDFIVQAGAPAAAPARLWPGDPLYARQWHMAQVQAERAWDASDGSGEVVAVLDTGVATAGADGFCRPLHSEYNALTDGAAPGAAVDRNGHGTHVAGTIAGCAGNGAGVAGLAYGAAIMAVKVLGDSGNGNTSDIAEGIVWAADHGAGVINMSLGASCGANWPVCSSPIVNDAVTYAAAADVVIVAAAGNTNKAYVNQPANHPEIIAVSATDVARNRAPYSSWGAAVDLAAPGGNAAADLNGDGYPDGVLQETFDRATEPDTWGYYYYQGTSMAAPHVAGAAALLRSCAPEATRGEIRAALEGGALDLGAAGWDAIYGQGFLQTHDALALLAARFGRDIAVRCDFEGGEPPCLVVDVVAPPGGSIALEPESNCNMAGMPGYRLGTIITATATAEAGYWFAGWTVSPPLRGSPAAAASPLVAPVYRNTSLGATFRTCLRLNVAAEGAGSLAVTPAPNCGEAGYSGGTRVALGAMPEPGHYFDRWLGDATGTTSPAYLTLSSDLSVTAVFASCLAVVARAEGPGRVEVTPPPTCAGGAGYSGRTALTLTAAPDPGYMFAGWSGAATGAANPLLVSLTADVEVTARFIAPPTVAVSLLADGTATALGPYRDEDVLLDDPAAGWSLLFDGSTVAWPGDVDALARLPDGTLLLSPDAPVKNLPGIGAAAVDDSDIVRFDPLTGRYSWYFDGSDVGLTLANEDVDALALLPDGRLLISTVGAVGVRGVSAADEDVLAFSGTLGSNATSGAWALYIDGSDLGASRADIDALAVFNGVVYLSTDAAATVGGLALAAGDVFACAGLTPGATTRCATVSRYWQAAARGLPATANVDALELLPR